MAASNNNTTAPCAACGKDGDGLKKCGACELVRYCGVDCQRAHRSTHKMECKKQAAELHDEALFKQPPSREDCPICFLELPLHANWWLYKTCCGKIICRGCEYASAELSEEDLCPFCREPKPSTDQEERKQIERRMELKDAEAIGIMGLYHWNGKLGLQQDNQKGLELLQNAVELGSMDAHYNLGCVYYLGKNGVEVEKKKAKYYWEIAAMEGHVQARHNLGSVEMDIGNQHQGMKHFMISARVGCDGSLKAVTEGYKRGSVTKPDFAETLRAHKKSKDEMKSEWRDRDNAADQILKLAGVNI